MFAVVDCTLDPNVHQGLLCHELACEIVTRCLTFPQSRVGCNTSVQDGETPAAVGMLLPGISALVSAGENSSVSLERPQCHPLSQFVFALAGQRGWVSPGTRSCHRAPGQLPVPVLVGGTSVYLPFHHLIAVPCHVAGASPWAASPV